MTLKLVILTVLLAASFSLRPALAAEYELTALLDVNQLVALPKVALPALATLDTTPITTVAVKEVRDEAIDAPGGASGGAVRAGSADGGPKPVFDHYEKVTGFVPVYKYQ